MPQVLQKLYDYLGIEYLIDPKTYYMEYFLFVSWTIAMIFVFFKIWMANRSLQDTLRK